MFHFCDLKLQQQFLLKEEVSGSKKETETLFDSLGEFLKAFDQANKVSQIPLPKPKFEIGFTKAKDALFSHCYKDIIEHLNTQIRLSFCLKRTRLAAFPSKSLTITAVNSFLQNSSTWVTTKSNIFTRIDILLLTSVTFWEQLRCVAHSPLFMGMTKALFFSLGTWIVEIQSVRVNIACTKRLLNLWAEAIIHVRNARLCARCAIFLLRIKRIPFSCRFSKRLTFLNWVQSQFKMLLEMCSVPVSIVSTGRNANLLAVM